jgi:hypothetical protein
MKQLLPVAVLNNSHATEKLGALGRHICTLRADIPTIINFLRSTSALMGARRLGPLERAGGRLCSLPSAGAGARLSYADD